VKGVARTGRIKVSSNLQRGPGRQRSKNGQEEGREASHMLIRGGRAKGGNRSDASSSIGPVSRLALKTSIPG